MAAAVVSQQPQPAQQEEPVDIAFRSPCVVFEHAQAEFEFSINAAIAVRTSQNGRIRAPVLTLKYFIEGETDDLLIEIKTFTSCLNFITLTGWVKHGK